MQFQQPSAQAHYNLHQLIQHQNRHRTEYLEVLPTLQAEKLSSFLTRLLSRVHTESYMAGNSTCKLHNDYFPAPNHHPNLDFLYFIKPELIIGNVWSQVTSQEPKLKQ
jgi:hypothetical protein